MQDNMSENYELCPSIDSDADYSNSVFDVYKIKENSK